MGSKVKLTRRQLLKQAIDWLKVQTKIIGDRSDSLTASTVDRTSKNFDKNVVYQFVYAVQDIPDTAKFADRMILFINDIFDEIENRDD